MLDPATWLDQAQALDVGRSRRIRHECGSGPVLKIGRTLDGWTAWCFRCNDKGWVPAPPPTLAERLARIERMQFGDASVRQLDAGCLPMPRVREVSEWPDGAALWLYKAGLSKADIGRLGIYYHPPSNRVVLPYGTFYQARAWERGQSPKYLGPTPKPPDLLVKFGKAECATLTEDMLSAMKVGDVAEGWAVLGTAISDHMIAALLERGAPVNLALDPDAAGRRGAAKYAKQLRAYGLTVRDILFPRDPKLMFRSELKEYLT